MLLGLFHWWWDAIGLSRSQVVLGVLGAAFAAGALVFAWRVARRQFRLMEEQGRIIEKQVELMQEQSDTSKRMETLAAETGRITMRQGEIAETHHRILQDQLMLRAEPYLTVMFSSNEDAHKTGQKSHTIGLGNTGTKPVREIRWILLVSSDYQVDVSVRGEGHKLPYVTRADVEEDEFWRHEGFATRLVFPGQTEPILDLAIPTDPDARTRAVRILWSLVHEGGRVPAGDDPFSVLHLTPWLFPYES